MRSSMWMCTRAVAVVTAVLLVGSLPAKAQEYRGTITGVVQDSTQAIIPDVELTLTNVGTNVTTKTTTTTAGAYTFPLVQPGVYRMEARKSGFKTSIIDELVVQTGAVVGR